MRPWLWGAVVLTVEYLATSWAFDAASLFALTPDWGGWLRVAREHIGQIGPIALTVATATILFDRFVSRPERPARTPRDTLSTILLVAGHAAAFVGFFVLTHWLSRSGGGPVPHARLLLSVWALFGLIAGVLLVLAIVPPRRILSEMRMIAPSLAVGTFVGSLAWLAGIGTEQLWSPLRSMTLHTAAALLRFFTDGVDCNSELSSLGTATFRVQIAPQCSGYEGIGLILVFMTTYLWLSRKRLLLPRALLLLPAAVVLIWLANAFRVAALVAVGTWAAPRVALGGFHSKAGWLLFCGIALGLVAVVERTGWFLSRGHATHVRPAATNPTAAYLVPLLAVVATRMITGLVSTDFDVLYPLQIVAGATALWLYRGYFLPLGWRWSWPALGLGIVVFLVWIGLESSLDESVAADWRRHLPGLSAGAQGAWFATRLFGSVILVPVVEELAFRGYLLRRLGSKDFTRIPLDRFTWFGLVGSSLAFGALHERWFAASIAGLFFALVLRHRGRLGDAVLCHATANALICGYAITSGRWSLWI